MILKTIFMFSFFLFSACVHKSAENLNASNRKIAATTLIQTAETFAANSSCSFIYDAKSEYDKNTVIKYLQFKGWSLNDPSAKFKWENKVTDSSCYDLHRAATCTNGGDYICLAHTKIDTNIKEKPGVILPKPLGYVKTTDCVTGDNVGEVSRRAQENFPKVISTVLAGDAIGLPDCWLIDETLQNTNGETILIALYRRYIEDSGYFDSHLFYKLLMNENIKLDGLKEMKPNLLFYLTKVFNKEDQLKFLENLQTKKRFSGLWNVNEKLPVEKYFIYESSSISRDTLLKILTDFKPNKSDLIAATVKDSLGNSLCIRYFSDEKIYHALQTLGGVTRECEENKNIELESIARVNNWSENKLKKDFTNISKGIFNYKKNMFAAIKNRILSVYDISAFPQKKLLYEFYLNTINSDPKISDLYVVAHINFNQDGNVILGVRPKKSTHYSNSDSQIWFIDVTNKKSTRIQLQDSNNKDLLKLRYSPTYYIGDQDTYKIKYYGLVRNDNDSPILITSKKYSPERQNASLDFVTCLTKELCILKYGSQYAAKYLTYAYVVKTGIETLLETNDVTDIKLLDEDDPYEYDRSGDLGFNPLASKPVVFLSLPVEQYFPHTRDTSDYNLRLGGFFDFTSLNFKGSEYHYDKMREVVNTIKDPYISNDTRWITGKNIFVQEVQNTKPYTNDFLNKNYEVFSKYRLFYNVYTVDMDNKMKKICTLPSDNFGLGRSLVNPSSNLDVLKYDATRNKMLILAYGLYEVDCND